MAAFAIFCIFAKDLPNEKNMRKTIIAMAAVMLLATSAVVVGKKGKGGTGRTVEVSFNYQKQDGPGSNQYAV